MHFVDDDTVLDPGYIGAIVDTFTGDEAGTLGGVGGFVTNQPPHRFRRVDVWLGLDGPTEGVVLPSGRNVRIYTEPREDRSPSTGCRAARCRTAARCSRRERPNLAVEHAGEDVELSYRVRQRFGARHHPARADRAQRIAARLASHARRW